MIISGGGGGGAVPKLAPDLSAFTERDSVTGYIILTAIDATAGLTTILSLTGKFLVNLLYFQGLTANDVDQIKLTIDDVVIFNEDGLADNAATHTLWGAIDGDHGNQFMCDSSLLLELETNVDSDFDFYYTVRPIL